MRGLFLYLFFLSSSSGYALGLADFVPNFLIPTTSDTSEHNSTLNDITKTESLNSTVGVQANNLSTNITYCDGLNQQGMHSVFCGQNANKTGTSSDFSGFNFNNTNPNGDANNIASTTPIPPASTINQSTLQDQELKSALNRYNSTYMLSIEPQSDVKISAGANQLQLNIKY